MNGKNFKKLQKESKKQIILEEVAKGTKLYKLINKLSEEWGISENSARLYIKDTLREIETDREDLISLNLHRLDSIIGDSMEEKDRKNAINGIREMNKMLGVGEKIEVSTNDDIVLTFNV